MHSHRLAWIAAALLAALLLLQTLRLAWLRGAAPRRLARARKRGRAGELAALALVEQAGYAIEVVQPTLQWTIMCDGEPHAVELRADLLVSRGGRTFVAEVKTGDCARLQTPSTRRQLLEYSVAYQVDGVLLIDVERARIQEVSFPRAQARTRSPARLVWAAIAVATAFAWAVLHHGHLP